MDDKTITAVSTTLALMQIQLNTIGLPIDFTRQCLLLLHADAETALV